MTRSSRRCEAGEPASRRTGGTSFALPERPSSSSSRRSSGCRSTCGTHVSSLAGSESGPSPSPPATARQVGSEHHHRRWKRRFAEWSRRVLHPRSQRPAKGLSTPSPQLGTRGQPSAQGNRSSSRRGSSTIASPASTCSPSRPHWERPGAVLVCAEQGSPSKRRAERPRAFGASATPPASPRRALAGLDAATKASRNRRVERSNRRGPGLLNSAPLAPATRGLLQAAQSLS